MKKILIGILAGGAGVRAGIEIANFFEKLTPEQTFIHVFEASLLPIGLAAVCVIALFTLHKMYSEETKESREAIKEAAKELNK